ncbi:protein cycle-like [Dermacentor andersoni]|uniref:protein cycle-like n=1 Tax=Dermacentor andersoni TaxID=34620 RepID=UPI002155F4C6|nr:basic helix-loop-helix ARNT-like protein 1 [Dermacentor andersoni]XP_054929590.1 basic helix-loop-helix ARNT-like protein 1 [Dermacentor andersoni]XP_054929591.1 basic helix-loop-helix ARNT-like protein 1 [Dermacentor andersoni]
MAMMTMPMKSIPSKGLATSPLACAMESSSSRMQRNFAEKQRRDKLNSYINELANIVPMVSMASKRLDKTSILRLSAAHLRFYQTALASERGRVTKTKWRPKFLSTDHLKDLLEVVDGFVLVTSTTGKIIYISPSVERFLGHQNIEMIGHSIFTFLHSADVQTVHDCFESLVRGPMQRRGDWVSSERCSFFCRIRERSQPRSEVLTYQVIQVVGHLTGPASDNANGQGSNCLFKTFVRLVNTNPYKELSLREACQDEYVTRHKLDGTIIFADHRLSTLTGHLPHEVLGVSAHKYLHPSDMAIAMFAQKQMFASNSGKGVVVYRLRTRDDSFIFLRSSGYLQYDQGTMQMDHFVCINTLMTEEEGQRELQTFFERFSPHITAMSVQELGEFFASYAARRTAKLAGFTEGSATQNPLSLSRLVEPNLYLGSDCLVKIKREPHDLQSDALIHGPEAAHSAWHLSQESSFQDSVQQDEDDDCEDT